jgi:hypothetical protein
VNGTLVCNIAPTKANFVWANHYREVQHNLHHHTMPDAKVRKAERAQELEIRIQVERTRLEHILCGELHCSRSPSSG